MYNVQKPLRVEVKRIEGSKICFTTACCCNDQRTPDAHRAVTVQLLECLALHEVGLDVGSRQVIVHIPALDGKIQFIGIQVNNFAVQKMGGSPFLFELRQCLLEYMLVSYYDIPFDVFEERIPSNIGRADNNFSVVIIFKKISFRVIAKSGIPLIMEALIIQMALEIRASAH